MRRDNYLDHWRGLFHIAMVVDHLPVLYPVSFGVIAGFYECLGYLSAAEGFVFLSGYVTGLVYTRIKEEEGVRAIWRKAICRASTIYATYVAAVLLLVLLVRRLGTASVSWGTWSHLLDVPLATATWQVASLLWRPTFLEILPLYSLFVLMAPAIVMYLDCRRLWIPIGISVSLWTADQLVPYRRLVDSLELKGDHFGYFDCLAWQILFVSGLICGHRSYRANGPWLFKGRVLAVAAYVFAVFFFLWHQHVFEPPLNEWWVRRSSLGPLRILNFGSIAFLAARFRGYVEPFINWTGFALLSRHSLQVFAFHLIPIYGVALGIAGEEVQLARWVQMLFISSGVIGLFCIAWLSGRTKACFRKATACRTTSNLGAS